jgi:hypothetical protein
LIEAAAGADTHSDLAILQDAPKGFHLLGRGPMELFFVDGVVGN